MILQGLRASSILDIDNQCHGPDRVGIPGMQRAQHWAQCMPRAKHCLGSAEFLGPRAELLVELPSLAQPSLLVF